MADNNITMELQRNYAFLFFFSFITILWELHRRKDVREEMEQDLLLSESSQYDLEMALLEKLRDDFKGILLSFELPKKLLIVDGPWRPESGLVTGALKIKRQKVEEAYNAQIDKAFQEMS